VPVRGVLLLIFFVLSLPACFVRPFYGIVLWMIVAFLNPQTALFYWNVAASFPWAVAVAIPTMAGLIIFSRGWISRIAAREVYLMAALWIWFTATSIISTHTPMFIHHAADTLYRWGFVSKIVLMTVVIIATVRSFSQLRILVLVICGCFGFFVLKFSPFLLITGGAFRLHGPEFSMIADNNDMGLALNMTAPLFYFLAKSETKRSIRWLFGLLFILTIPAIFFTYSRGALVGLIVVLAILFLHSGRLALVPVVVAAVVIALLFAPQAWRNRMDPTRPEMIDASARSRLNAWSYAWNLAMDYPITGGGFSTFTPQLYALYAPAVDYEGHGAHSIYFQVLGEHGFVGLSLFLALICSAFVTGHRLVRTARLHRDELVIQYTNMFRLSLIGFLASGMFLGRAYFDYFFTILACLIILGRVAATEWAEADEMTGTPEESDFEPTSPPQWAMMQEI
jgi:probable O-glycosylation ligase (exosortase A-associated)